VDVDVDVGVGADVEFDAAFGDWLVDGCFVLVLVDVIDFLLVVGFVFCCYFFLYFVLSVVVVLLDYSALVDCYVVLVVAFVEIV